MILLSKLIPLFIIMPLAELAVLIQLGKWIGVFETIGLCIVTAIIGIFLIQLESSRVWGTWQIELMQGRMPTDKIIDGVMIFVGGILLLIPGILTDILGLTLILPFTRLIYRESWLKKKFRGKISTVNYHESRKQAEVKVIEE